MKSSSKLLFLSFLALNQLLLIAGHGYVSHWSADGNSFQRAQKTPLTQTAFRGAPSNTGWIGSKFINSEAFTCGASETPMGVVAPPSGKIFSRPDQSAKKTLQVKAGGKVELIISGEKGKGFPHPKGHIQAFLGKCGTGKTDCQNFDASKTKYFKIQSELNGISDRLRKIFDYNLDGNKWEIPIPSNVESGSYILRVEMVAFGQSGAAEGHQDQYYVYCGQIFVEGNKTNNKAPKLLLKQEEEFLSFPGAYKTGNIDPSTLPAPIKVESLSVLNGGENDQEKSQEKASDEDDEKKSGKDETVKIKSFEPSKKSSSEKESSENKKEEESEDTEGIVTTNPSKIKCADDCYKANLRKLKGIAPKCSRENFECLCSSSKFVSAYEKCCKHACGDKETTDSAVEELHHRCGSSLASKLIKNPSEEEDSPKLSSEPSHPPRCKRKRRNNHI